MEKICTYSVSVLFLRHKLQKGFLSRDQAPIESEMTTMSEHFNTLEQYSNLEAPIIRTTKINKVLKGIIKLNSIPKEEEFNFKKRSTELLSVWNRVLNADDGPSAGGDVTTTTEKRESAVNGTSHEKVPEGQKDKDEETEERNDTEMETEQKDDENKDNDNMDTKDGEKEEAAQAGTTNGTDSMEIDKAEEPMKGEEDKEEEKKEEGKNAEALVASTENATSTSEMNNEVPEGKTETVTKEDKDTEMET